MPLEKNCRVNHDAASLSRVLVAIVEICYNKKAWKDLNENIAALTKVLFSSVFVHVIVVHLQNLQFSVVP